MKLVEVVGDGEVAKLLSDPMRRAILNLLRNKLMTESDLAESLGLTAATVNYHLGLLRKAKLVLLARREVEEHGIMQKFYTVTAYLFLPDVESLPREVSRYYYPINIERMRGALSALEAEEHKVFSVRGRKVDDLGEELAKILVRVARGRGDEEIRPGEGEEKVGEIYSEAFEILFSTAKGIGAGARRKR